MGTRRIILAAAGLAGVIATSAFAADDMAGVVTRIDRLNSTISIQQVQKGTVGDAGGSGPLQDYKAKDAAMLDSVHAGDRVTYSTSGSAGAETLTTIKKQ